MGLDISLHDLGTETTTTLVEAHAQPREVDTIAQGAAVDLGDDRACSIELFAEADPAYPAHARAILECTIETHEAPGEPWREVARFTRLDNQRGFVRERATFVADRYLRASWRVAPNGGGKGGVRFSLTGRATGGA